MAKPVKKQSQNKPKNSYFWAVRHASGGKYAAPVPVAEMTAPTNESPRTRLILRNRINQLRNA